jgi:hypothetical protein
MSRHAFATTLSRILLILAIGTIPLQFALADVTYNYTGNPFTGVDTTPGFAGDHLIASVTFLDSVIGFTGVANAPSVLSWSIQVAEVPTTRIDSSFGSLSTIWPPFFSFENGTITSWQLLAAPNPFDQFPELYTTHNTNFPSINPTADYYISDHFANNVGSVLNNAGSWSPVTVPLPSSLVAMLSSFLIIGMTVRRKN